VRFETVWGGTQAAIGGTVAIALAATDDFTTAFAFLALTSWPLALGVHGAWAQRSDPYDGFPSAVLPVVGLDVGILAYDGVRIARRDQPSSAYGFAEDLRRASASRLRNRRGSRRSRRRRPRDARDHGGACARLRARRLRDGREASRRRAELRHAAAATRGDVARDADDGREATRGSFGVSLVGRF